MKAKRYTEEQIIGILKEHEAGANLADLVRRHGVSEQSFYRWKSKYGGMEVSEAKRLRELESENSRLKKLLAEAKLDKAILEDVLRKKWRGRPPATSWPIIFSRPMPSAGGAPATWCASAARRCTIKQCVRQLTPL